MHILVLAILCLSCSADLDTTTATTKNKVNNLENYIALGKLHNDLLEVAEEVCAEEATRSSDFTFMAKDSVLFSRIHSQQLMAVKNMEIGEAEKAFLTASLNENILYYQTDSVYEAIGTDKSPIPMKSELDQLINQGIIDAYEYTVIASLLNYINQNHETGDHEALKKHIELECKMWDIHYGKMEEKAGEFSGRILGIAKASIDWWDENYEETRALPAWVGADAAGAIIGAIHNAGTQYIATGKVDAKQVGYHALGSAVISSTGVVKCVATWINRAITIAMHD